MFAAKLLAGSAEKFTAQSPLGHRGGVLAEHCYSLLM